MAKARAARLAIVAAVTLIALLLIARSMDRPQLVSETPAIRSAGVASGAVRASRIYTLADGMQAYRVVDAYTTTIGGIDWQAWIENRPFDEYGRELPYHQGFHYVKVSPTAEISPTGQWDLVYSSLSYLVTETVSWKSDAISPTGWITSVTGVSPTIVITLPVWTNEAGEISGTVTASMIITQAIGSAPVAGAISTTRFISEDGAIVPGTISATLWMVFEVQDSARGLQFDFKGHTGSFTLTAEQDPVFTSAAINVADFGRAQIQVRAQAAVSNTAIVWWPQFAPAVNGSCGGAVDWSDGAATQRAYLDPDRGSYIWQPLLLLARTVGAEAQGFEIVIRNECARVAFTGPAGVAFTPTIHLRPF